MTVVETALPASLAVAPGSVTVDVAGAEKTDAVLESVQNKIAPVWPLKDYIAVNPYLGFSDRKFLHARSKLQAVSNGETLMDLDYYRRQFHSGALLKLDIDVAIDELVADGVEGAESLSAKGLVTLLRTGAEIQAVGSTGEDGTGGLGRALRTLTEFLDDDRGSGWSDAIREEISKHCAAHYDQGQAFRSSPWSHLSLYQAWQAAMRHDRAFELLGVAGFRKLVASLPGDPDAAIAELLGRMQVPEVLWEDFLLCQALAAPGWSAWAKYQVREADLRGEPCTDFAGLLAIRLTCEYAVARRFDFQVNWDVLAAARAGTSGSHPAAHDALRRYALLHATEVAYRRRLLENLTSQPAPSGDQAPGAGWPLARRRRGQPGPWSPSRQAFRAQRLRPTVGRRPAK